MPKCIFRQCPFFTNKRGRYCSSHTRSRTQLSTWGKARKVVETTRKHYHEMFNQCIWDSHCLPEERWLSLFPLLKEAGSARDLYIGLCTALKGIGGLRAIHCTALHDYFKESIEDREFSKYGHAIFSHCVDYWNLPNNDTGVVCYYQPYVEAGSNPLSRIDYDIRTFPRLRKFPVLMYTTVDELL